MHLLEKDWNHLKILLILEEEKLERKTMSKTSPFLENLDNHLNVFQSNKKKKKVLDLN